MTELLAITEDGEWAWVTRDCTPQEAADAVADDYGHQPGDKIGPDTVKPVFLRPWTQEDCEAKAHGRDEYGDPEDEDCTCSWHIEEGWQAECPESHPAAVPAWRVDRT